jgi:hypothetical protein
MEGGAPLSAERVLARTFLRSDRSAGLKPFHGAVSLPGIPGIPGAPGVSILAFQLQSRGRIATLS